MRGSESIAGSVVALDAKRVVATGAINIARLVQLGLGVDLAILDLERHSERQRQLGAVPLLTSAAAAIDAIESADTALVRLADPVAAQDAGFPSYASVPIRDDEQRTIGQLAVASRASRAFGADDLKLMRVAADLAAELLG